MAGEIDWGELRRSPKPMKSFREPRHSVMMQATLSCDGAAASARIRNISRGGMMAECRLRGQPGQRVAVLMRGLGEIAGAVTWAVEDRIGVMFDQPIDPEAVLRRPVTADDRMQAPRPVAKAWRPSVRCS